MAEPIYKIAIYKSLNLSHLSVAEHEKARECIFGGLERTGGRTIIRCDSYEEHWRTFVLQEFPDLESLRQHHANLEEVRRSTHYIWESASYLGYKVGGTLKVSPDKPLIKAYFVKNRIGMSRVTDADQQRLREQLPEAIIRCRCLEQDWFSMGVEQYADPESLHRWNQALAEFQENHGDYWDAMTLFGREREQ